MNYKSDKQSKQTNQEPFIIEQNHLYYGLAMMVAILVLTFGMGYYYGKKYALNEFMNYIEQESFNDKIFNSLCSLYEVDDEREEEQVNIPEPANLQADEQESIEPVEQPSPRMYYAELAGFAQLKTAQAYRNKLMADGLKVDLVTRTSASSQGKIKNWYQIVTQPYAQKALEECINAIALRDHLKDIKIKEYIINERPVA